MFLLYYHTHNTPDTWWKSTFHFPLKSSAWRECQIPQVKVSVPTTLTSLRALVFPGGELLDHSLDLGSSKGLGALCQNLSKDQMHVSYYKSQYRGVVKKSYCKRVCTELIGWINHLHSVPYWLMLRKSRGPFEMGQRTTLFEFCFLQRGHISSWLLLDKDSKSQFRGIIFLSYSQNLLIQ